MMACLIQLIHSTFAQCLRSSRPAMYFTPPDVQLSFTTILSIFYLFSSASLRAHWMELSQNLPHFRKWVQFENACPKFGVSLPSINLGPITTYFRRFSTTSQLKRKFNSKYCLNEDVDNWGRARKTTGSPLQCLKISWTLVHKRLIFTHPP